MVKTFHAFFGKIIRVKGMRFIILYFNTETHLMNAINESAKINDISQGLWLKKENDFIDENGELKELTKRSNYKNDASRSNAFCMKWEQQGGPSTHSALSRRHNQ
ncbi:unnamed protein product [Rhizophagus irregularis]|nr:unnamed protein product [Rhizophagus irregularis]